MKINTDMIASLETHQKEFTGVYKILAEAEKAVRSACTSFEDWIKSSRGLASAMERYEQAMSGAICGSLPPEEQTENPFRILLTWIRAETLDVKVIIETIKSKDKFILQKVHIEHNMRVAETSLEKARQGKFRLKALLTNKERSIVTLENQIETARHRLEMIDFILYIIVARTHSYELPKFKERKGDMYIASIKQFVGTLSKNLERHIEKYDLVCRPLTQGGH